MYTDQEYKGPKRVQVEQTPPTRCYQEKQDTVQAAITTAINTHKAKIDQMKNEYKTAFAAPPTFGVPTVAGCCINPSVDPNFMEKLMKNSACVVVGHAGGQGPNDPNDGKDWKEIARFLWEQFQSKSRMEQCLILAGIAITVLCVGYYSYHFLKYAWPYIIKFAKNPAVHKAGKWILDMWSDLQVIVKAWKNGEMITPAVILRCGKVIGKILELAPYLFGNEEWSCCIQ